MEGVIILANEKRLLSSHFVNPALADLAVDAFLSARRNGSSSSSGSVARRRRNNHSPIASQAGLDPITWFEAFDPSAVTRIQPGQSSLSSSSKRAARSNGPTRNHAAQSSYDDGDSSEESSSDEENDEDAQSQDDAAELDPWAVKGQVPSSSSTGAGTGMRSYACCHISHNNLHFLAPVSRETEPSVVFSYLYSLLGVLKQYLLSSGSDGSLNDHVVRENFDIVLQLLGETFNAPHPISTDASALQELVPSSSLLVKLLAVASSASSAVAAASSGPGPAAAAPFSSPLHWRRAGIRHSQNEIFFDINEDIDAVLDREGKVVSGSVWGRIDCRSKLSGMPDISLTFSNPSLLEDPSFHPCVRLGKWASAKVLSFVPPDGGFELMGYRLSSSATAAQSSLDARGHSSRRAVSSSASSQSGGVPVPLRVRPVITLGEVGGSFTISLGPTGQFFPGGLGVLEDIVVSLYLGADAAAVSGGISNPATFGPMSSSAKQGAVGNGSGGRSGRMGGASGLHGERAQPPPGGKWEFDSLTHTLYWRIPRLSVVGAGGGSNAGPTLSGTWQYDDAAGMGARRRSGRPAARGKPSPVVEVTFSAALSNISGICLTNLKLEGERYSTYKGFRSNLKGHLEVRW